MHLQLVSFPIAYYPLVMKDPASKAKPTLQNVADYAGVSIASVSRVLNNIPPISEELRRQVESAIRDLGYKAKRGSASIQASVTVLIGDLHNTYFSDIISGIQNIADQKGILINIVVNQPIPSFSTDFFRWITRTTPMGLIICSSNVAYTEELQRLHELQGLPIVLINPPANIPGLPSIRIDYEQGMAKAVQHAVKFHHTRIALVNGCEGAYSSLAKKRGVAATLDKTGYPLRQEYYVEQPATIEGGFQAMNILLALPIGQWPTAVIASTDLMGLGAIHAIRSHGLSIPDDITVIGFDDIAMAAHANPPLTTISPPKFEMGYRAMNEILNFNKRESPAHNDFVVMESPLIVRESSGPCKKL